MHRTFAVLLLFTCLACAEEKQSVAGRLIPWLIEESESLKNIPFSEVIAATSGRRVIPVDKTDPETRRILRSIASALDAVLAGMNASGSPAKAEGRVNEMSAHFEDALQKRLDAAAGFSCDFPKTAEGRKQRSGYPDLRLVDKKTGRVIYLDPKLYARGSRASSLRTFYFTPKRETNKVNDDAHHLIVGFENEKGPGGIVFAKWELIDLAKFRVQLKAEFEGSNRDLYRDDAVVERSK